MSQALQMSFPPLPAPRRRGGRPLMEALAERRSARSFATRSLEPQLLADLLWAASGVNRLESAHLTAPSARNWQEIAVYVALAQGYFRYQPPDASLVPLGDADIRGEAGVQDFVATAPVNLIYVADRAKIEGSNEDKAFFAGADSAFMAENVYLFCASEGLACVVRALIDRSVLAQTLKLAPEQRITLAQSVGYPSV